MAAVVTVGAVCPKCGEPPGEPHARGVDFEYASTGSHEWSFRRCERCEVISLSPRPAESEMARIYPRNYYAYDFAATPSLGYRVKEHLDRRATARYLKWAGAGSILDVGCGDGRLLRIFERLGVPAGRLFGLELDERAVTAARASGFQVDLRRLEDAEYPGASFGLVVMQQVIEHVPEPRAALAKVRALLSPGGAAVFETPNTASWDHAIFRRRYWGGYHVPRHFHLFNRRSLPALLRDEGFEVLKVESLLSPNFWIQSLHHSASERGAPAWVRRLLRPHPPQAAPLAFFSALDIVGKGLGVTSNMRVVAVRR